MIKENTRNTWHRTRQTIAPAVRTFYIFLTTWSPPFSGHPRFVFPFRTLSSEPRGRRGGGRHSRDQDFQPIICVRFGNMPTVNVLWCATPRGLLRGRLRTGNTPSSPTSLGKQKRNCRRSPADSRTFFVGAVSPLLGPPSFRFPFLYSLFRTPRATRWGAALAASKFLTHYLRTLWKYANGKRSLVRNAL